MGIKGLMKLLSEHAPGGLKQHEIKNYFSRKVAIDASMCLYQFLIAVRQDGQNLTNESGEVTSHLQGMFYRTLRMMDHGIKPIYVFDGKPPVLKGGELEKRKEKREEAKEELKAAEEANNQEDINKYSKRLVRVTKEQNEEVKKLLRLMGVPIVEASGEAEATCAAMCKAGLVYATATEDMDALTFGSSRLIRNLTASAAKELPIIEVDLNTVLDEMKLSQKEFVDLCILLGCDYTGTIKGIGPQKAFALISKHKSIEASLPHLDDKSKVPDDFLYKEAAELFVHPDVADVKSLDLKWGQPDEEAIVNFLVGEKGFAEDRVRKGMERIRKAKQAGSQQRMDSFFNKTAAPSGQGKDGKGKEGDKKRKLGGAAASSAKKPKTSNK